MTRAMSSMEDNTEPSKFGNCQPANEQTPNKEITTEPQVEIAKISRPSDCPVFERRYWGFSRPWIKSSNGTKAG
jgi:hypothetical protein